jgi:hypothetical protein
LSTKRYKIAQKDKEGARMNFYEMFVQGLKPAIYRNTLDKQFNEKLPFLLENFPYIEGEKVALIPDPEVGTYIFFQNEELKADFSAKLENVEPGSKEFHKVLGSALGYPPKAVQFFAESWVDESLDQLKVGMYYLGIGCSGSIEDLTENCLWLWNQYQIEEGIKVRLGTNFTEVDYMDLEKLEHLKIQYTQKLKHIA